MKDAELVKVTSMICGTAILIVMLYTDGPVAFGAAAASALACFGVGGYLGKK